MRNINWNAVYGFWLVSEHHSFAHAARALPFGSIQALHKRVRSLESKENLNLKLLRSRGVKGIELTEAGQRVFQLISPVFRDFERLTAELRGEDSGSLHIAATAFGSNNYVGDIVSAFSPRFPDVSIHLYLREPMDDVLELVESGRVDFGICAPTSGLADCEVKASVPLRFEIILPRGHRLRKGIPSWKELLREPLILPERDMVLRKAFDDLMERENLSGQVRLKAELTTSELSVDAVRAGLGVALIAVGPRVVPSLHGVVRTTPPPGLPMLNLTMLCKKNRYLANYMQGFAEITSGVFNRRDNATTFRQPGRKAR